MGRQIYIIRVANRSDVYRVIVVSVLGGYNIHIERGSEILCSVERFKYKPAPRAFLASWFKRDGSNVRFSDLEIVKTIV